MSDGKRILLDTDLACRQELEEVSTAMAFLIPEYIKKCEDLARVEEQLDLLRARTLIGTDGANKEEREAKVIVALHDDPETGPVVRQYNELAMEVTILKQRLKTLEARGSHAQSAIKSHQQARFDTRAGL